MSPTAASGNAPAIVDTGLPRQAGIGFKPAHFDDLLDDPRPPAFIEIHAENYFGDGGRPWRQLERLRRDWPVSVHGVGLSLGGESPLSEAHLDRLARVLARSEAAVFSEHLAWATHAGHFLNDLLPLPYTDDTLARVCRHIDQAQSRLRRRLLLENPATYLQFETSDWAEADFLAEVVARTGCGLLLDLNNVHVSCHNHRLDPQAYLAALPLAAVGEIHLAGHSEDRLGDGESLLIDDHGGPVAAPVWALYSQVLAAIGPCPTLIEWDNRVPDYATLRAQAREADRRLQGVADLDRVRRSA